jgi:hypothetical protein
VADQDDLFNVTVINPPQSSGPGSIRAGDRTRAAGRLIAPPPRPAQQPQQQAQPRPAQQLPSPQFTPRAVSRPAGQVATQTLPPIVINPWEPTTPHRYQQVLDAAAAMQQPGVTPPVDLSEAIDFINTHCALDQQQPAGSGRLICRPAATGGQPAFLEDWLRANYAAAITPTEPARPDAYGANQINCYSSGVFATEADRQMWLAMHPGCPEPPVESVRAQATLTVVPSKIPIVPIVMVAGGVAAGSLAIYLLVKAMGSKSSKRSRRDESDDDDDDDGSDDE